MRFSQFGPAIGALYAGQTPEARAEVVAELAQMLAPTQDVGVATAIGPGFAAAQAPRARPAAVSAKTKRTAVAALRRLGGEDVIAALFVGLVGPPVRQGTAVGMAAGPRPDMDGRPAWVRAATSARVAGRGVPITTAAFIARALGSMGQAELLGQSLNAPGRQFFLQDSTTVQKAAVEGMAYLPAEHKPIERLRTLLMQARSADLREAVADAILTAVRRLGVSSAEASAS